MAEERSLSDFTVDSITGEPVSLGTYGVCVCVCVLSVSRCLRLSVSLFLFARVFLSVSFCLWLCGCSSCPLAASVIVTTSPCTLRAADKVVLITNVASA